MLPASTRDYSFNLSIRILSLRRSVPFIVIRRIKFSSSGGAALWMINRLLSRN